MTKNKTIQGTPKTLAEAIRNGMHDAVFQRGSLTPEQQVQVVEKHVLDYLRQKFAVTYLQMDGMPAEEVVLELARNLNIGWVSKERVA